MTRYLVAPLGLAVFALLLWASPRCTPSSPGFYLAGTILLAGCPN